MHIYLPIAEVSVPAESLLFLGVAVGFLSGVFGVGGGFLATPFLLFMGIPPAVAVGTQANQLIATSMTGVLGHWRRGHVDRDIGMMMLAGGTVGTILGILLFRLLDYFGQIDVFIALAYVLLLGSIGSMMLIESVFSLLNRPRAKEAGWSFSQSLFCQNLPYQRHFPKSQITISIMLPIGVGMIGGLLVSVLGIGGGFILVPAMIYILGMPSVLVPGTSLFQILFISAFACFLHALANQTVDLILALIMIAGGVVGAQIGVYVAKYIRGAPARIGLALIIIGVCLSMLGSLILEPSDLYVMDIRS